MPSFSYFRLVALLAASLLSADANFAQEARPLFNGRDLSGWVLVNTPPQTWSVKEGMLICTGKPIGEIRTERMFQNVELELEWRHMVPGGNAGIFVWADDITAPGVPFHRGIEVQVLENAYGQSESHTTHGDIFPIHGATMTPENGRRGSRAFPTEERSKPSPEWNHYKIICQDGNISLAVNGKVVTKGKDASPRKGYICLESEGGVVHYRNIQIKELPDSPVDPQHIAIANRGYRSIYTGLDLSGWEVNQGAKSAWQADDWVLKFNGQVTGSQSAITHKANSKLSAVIVDFRLSDQTKSLKLDLPGADPIVLSPSDSTLTKHLKKAGTWNRIEVRLAERRLLINGQSVPLNVSQEPTQLTLLPEGPVELANLYVGSAEPKP